MATDQKALRIEGIYQQNDAGQYMLRVKLACGLLSVVQATVLAQLGQIYGSGTMHLSTRGSIEFHALEYRQIPHVQRGLATVGLFSRGACGGAVRGISSSTSFGRGFNFAQVLGRKLLLHFSGNPLFENLPKKFKIAVEADYAGSRHLIQDLAFVFAGHVDGQALYDVWVGGGLGRAPQAAILLQERVPEAELLTLAEAIIRVYAARVPAPKRLKTLIGRQGEKEFRRLLAEELGRAQRVQLNDAYDKALLPVSGDAAGLQLVVPVFAGELPAEQLGLLADAAGAAGCAYLLVTSDQDLALLPVDKKSRQLLIDSLSRAGFSGLDQLHSVMRVCPGNHDCRMGLAATRELAGQLQQRFGERLSGTSLAISGCLNSCAQPQLAEFGIIASKSIKGESGQRSPRFDLYRPGGGCFGERVAAGLTEAELYNALDKSIRVLAAFE